LQTELIRERSRRYAEEAKTERAHYASMRAPIRAPAKARARGAPKEPDDVIERAEREVREFDERTRRR
jgi:hypothetical protein